MACWESPSLWPNLIRCFREGLSFFLKALDKYSRAFPLIDLLVGRNLGIQTSLCASGLRRRISLTGGCWEVAHERGDERDVLVSAESCCVKKSCCAKSAASVASDDDGERQSGGEVGLGGEVTGI